MSYFKNYEKGTVTCPMGCVLNKTSKKGMKTIYASRSSCRQCRNKCTVSLYKHVAFGPESEYVPVMMHRVEGVELLKLPRM